MTNNQSSTLTNSTIEKPDAASLPTIGSDKSDQMRRIDLLQPIRRWLDEMEINDPKLARFLSKTIPAQCPFERDITLFGRRIVRIPPLCKLNPLYEQLVGLRFRALCYLVDCCGEDIQFYA